jgi:hypothetical protein
MVYRGLGKVVNEAGDQQDFEVVEFDFGSGIWGIVWEVGIISVLSCSG